VKFILSAFCLLFSIQAFAEINLSDNVEVYKGDGNLTVTLVRVLPLDSNQALLSVSGIDHELSGLVFNYDLTFDGDNRKLTTDIYGRRYNSFVETSSWGRKRQTLYIPGKRDGANLYFDSEASESAKPSELLKRHKEQKAAGKLSAVQLFNRSKEEKETTTALIKTQESLEKACGKSINVSVDWSTISDELIIENSVSGYCSEATSAVESLCKDKNVTKKAWIKKSIDTISCEFGESMRLKLDSKKLIFKSVIDESNQRDFVKQNLRNLI